jgi:hypothetical protein
VRPEERISVGTAAAWHFRLAAGLFAAAAAGEFGAQAVRGVEGAGPTGWLALLGTGSWVVGLVWRERVGVGRAWRCVVWVVLMSLLVMMLATRHGFLFGHLEFIGREFPAVGPVPLSVPLLWWLMVGGGYLVVEGLWGELRAGVSAFTALIAVQMALMLLPFLTSLRAYWRWPAGSAGGAFFGLPWAVLTAWLTLALGLSFGLVIVGENWSSPEARTRRQAWAPAAVLLTLTFVCLVASLLARLWLAVAFSAVNGVLFGTVVVWYLRERGARP